MIPDLDDLHVYGGLLLLAIGGALVAPALGLAVMGAGLIALGLLYSLAAAKAEKSKPLRPVTFDALKTADAPADETA